MPAPKARRSKPGPRKTPNKAPGRRAPVAPPPPPVVRQRRSLSQRGGEITSGGDEQLSSILSRALEASSAPPEDDLTHGFHSYPARMHPAIASLLIAELSEPGQNVLDPFVGSGTVLIEALAQGRRGVGVDLNPLALRIAQVRCQLRDRTTSARFARALDGVAEASEESVRSRARVSVPIGPQEREMYEPHVLLELSGLWGQIGRAQNPLDRETLEIVFSSLLVKFSRQAGDTSEERIEKRIRKGLVTEFFARKGHELILRWEALARTAPQGATPVKLVQGDARNLPQLAPRAYQADLVLTSPPYGGTYDYVSHHARRYAWLGLDDSMLRQYEIGARRNFVQAGGAARWDAELGAALKAMVAVLADNGRIVLWIGDADLAGARVSADEQVARLGARVGLRLVAQAAQERPDFRGGPGRREHLLLLSRAR